MEQLRYTVEDKTIAYLLGTNNFTNNESAVLELVKNAYDAKAEHLVLEFAEDELTLTDDGEGMNEKDIREWWMHVGKSDKGYSIIDTNNQERILAGSKGVGRFALARLGEEAKLYSQKRDSEGIVWETDWNISKLNVVSEKKEIGTKIVISKLRDKWTKKEVEKLCDFLSKTYNDQKMQIKISHPDMKKDVPQYLSMPKVGENCLSMIQLKYQSKKKTLSVEIASDEFLDEAQAYCKVTDQKNKITYIIDLHEEHKSFDIVKELKAYVDEDLPEDYLTDILEKLGDFSAVFHFSVKPTESDAQKFLYKHSVSLNPLPQKLLPSGIILYRNAFSISAYEGKKDWLGLGARARKSPAAATHQSGAWVVRENQIGGRVYIDRKQNSVLRDLSNRQGLEENIYYQLFIQIILTGIREFERYRQDIIRHIDKKNKLATLPKTPLLDGTLTPAIITDLSEEDKKQLVFEIKNLQEGSKRVKQEKEKVEKMYKYDVRVLNVLATMSLKAASIAHEMRNDRNFVASNTKNIINALVAYGMWDDLNSPEKTAKTYKNVPYLLETNKKINVKVQSFVDTMLSEVEKKKFKPAIKSMVEVLYKIKDTWENDYGWISIAIDMAEDIKFYISEDMIQVIFDNLILNSIQQNGNTNHLSICIMAKEINDKLEFLYSDDGKGLDEKYSGNTRRILEVFETTRRDGHGLGMWIVNNTVIMSGGEVGTISGTAGFSIEFTIGSAPK